MTGEGTLYWHSQEWDSQALVEIVYRHGQKPCGYALVLVSPVSTPGNGYFVATLVTSVRFTDSKGRQVEVSEDYCFQRLSDAKDSLK